MVFEFLHFDKRLGLPSTLIRHENGTFRKCSSTRRNLKTPALRYIHGVDGKHFAHEAFRKRWRYNNCVIPLSVFHSNKNPKWPVIVVFSNFSGVVWYLMRVQQREMTKFRALHCVDNVKPQSIIFEIYIPNFALCSIISFEKQTKWLKVSRDSLVNYKFIFQSTLSSASPS